MNSNLSFSSIKKAIFSIFFCFVFIANANTKTSNYLSKYFSLKKKETFVNDPLLVLKVEQVDSKKLLRISFNGNEGIEAEIKILDDKNTLISSFNLELIKSPYYATVDVTNLQSGNYSVILNTKMGLHNSKLHINK
jgi:N-acetylneuraminic acid mutarotase